MKNNNLLLKNLATLLLFTLILYGCGGGGGSDSTSTTNNSNNDSSNDSSDSGNSNPSVATEWQQGIYPDPALLKNYCENPRSSNTYADKQGSNFLEKMWLRSWSNDIYLWYRELNDIDVASVGTPQAYFATRQTFATTQSGAAKDQFHFIRDTAEYNQQVSSGASVGYGMTLKFKGSIPRKATVGFIKPGSPAANANISRGAEIISIDGADFINGNDIATLNNGLFPHSSNESHTFEIKDYGSASTRTVTLNSSTIVEEPVQYENIFTNISTGEKVGYVLFDTFATNTAEKSLLDTFNTLASQGVSDLVLDIRYNGGGFLAISSQLAYMIAGPNNTSNQVYYKTVFNDKYPNTDPFTGEQIRSYPFIDTGIGLTVPQTTSLPSLNLNRVFVLTTDSSCSASEALINGLQGIGVEVIQIGGKTCGKPYGFRGTDNCGSTYFTIMFKGVNRNGFGDYADGFYPSNSTDIGSVSVAGCQVADDYSKPLGDLNEAMLAAALNYRDSRTCPSPSFSGFSQRSSSKSGKGDLLEDSRVRSKLLSKQILLID